MCWPRNQPYGGSYLAYKVYIRKIESIVCGVVNELVKEYRRFLDRGVFSDTAFFDGPPPKNQYTNKKHLYPSNLISPSQNILYLLNIKTQNYVY